MTTYVNGAVDETVLAPLGRRVIVRDAGQGVSMVDVAGVDDAMVADVLADAGHAIVPGPPATPAPAATTSGPAPVVVTTSAPASDPPPAPATVPYVPPVALVTGPGPVCTSDDSRVLGAVAELEAAIGDHWTAARDEVHALRADLAATPPVAPAAPPADLAPLSSAIAELRADVAALEPAQPAGAAPLPWTVRLAHIAGGAAGATLVTLLARIH